MREPGARWRAIIAGKALEVALVVLGGALGTTARVLAGWAVDAWLGHGLPYDILLVNVTGAYLLGALAGLVPASVRHQHPHWLVWAVGFLGAYTTFSSLAYGSVALLRAGRTLDGLLYPLGSLALGMLATGLGDLTGAWVQRQTTPPTPPRAGEGSTDVTYNVEESAVR
jgi:CrcB protein